MRALVLFAAAMVGCGPPPLDLLRAEQKGRRPADALRAVREACTDHTWASSCRIALAEACGRVTHDATAAAAEDFARRRFPQVVQRVEQPAEGCAAGAELRRMSAAAEALERCARAGDDACELQVVARLDADRAELPSLGPWLARQRVSLCGLALDRAGEGDPAAAYPEVVRLCTPAERGGVRARIVAEVTGGAQEGTAAALSRCRALIPLDPSDEGMKVACAGVRDSLTQKLGHAVDSAWAAGRIGAAVALLAEGRRRGTPAATRLDAQAAQARLEREARWPVSLAAPDGIAGGLRVAAVGALERGAAPTGFRWALSDDQAPLQVQLDGVVGFKLTESRASQPGKHRYLKGYRKVDNPDWAPARRACRSARGALKRCRRDRARALRRFDRCETRRDAAQDRYTQCQQQARASGKAAHQVCTAPAITCPPRPGRCASGSANRACSALDQTPRYVDEPVYANHRYRIAEITRQGTAQVAVSAERRGASLGRWDRRLRVTARDTTHPAAPAVGLAEDPLDLPGEDGMRARVAAEAARAVTTALREVHRDRCQASARARAALLAQGAHGARLDAAARDAAAGCGGAAADQAEALARVVADL